MKCGNGRSRRWRDAVFGATAAALLSVSAAACGTVTADSSPGPDRTAATLSASLATTTSSSRGSWAVVPMGHLGDPLNTFWQLFFRPRGATRWIDKAASLAIATNGGIVMGPASRGAPFTVGVRRRTC